MRRPLTQAVMALSVLLPAALTASGGARAQPAPPDGATLFRRQCMTCHAAEAGAPHRQGPNLHGVFGRRAGEAEGFRYSAALKASNLLWDEATLDAWLADSAALVPGSVMPYRQANATTRAAVIGWLKDRN